MSYRQPATATDFHCKIPPPLDPEFKPAALWDRAYARGVAESKDAGREVCFALSRPDGICHHAHTRILPALPEFEAINLFHCERFLKSLLWIHGGNRISIAGAPEIAEALALQYSEKGQRQFDHHFLGERCFRQAMSIQSCDSADLPPESRSRHEIGRHLDGCRIGFDLGGSDRKCAAIIDGKVVFSEEIKWDPYFQSDPNYHIEGIRDSIRRAQEHLPRVDAIGGSAAGIYIDNEVRVASLFRGIPIDEFDRSVSQLFKQLKKEWNDVPFEVANDGDVTALAGSMALETNNLLGIAMGTSQAAGFIDDRGHITGWLNELAFAPIDYRDDAPQDEWSGDRGCGVQYFSQQAVARLLPVSGLQADPSASPAEQLEFAQERLQQDDHRAQSIFETIGTYFGYAVAQYADIYHFDHLLLLGRVSSGRCGDIILDQAREVLASEFPELADTLQFHVPDERTKRHGQAIAAASLPAL